MIKKETTGKLELWKLKIESITFWNTCITARSENTLRIAFLKQVCKMSLNLPEAHQPFY